MVNSPYTIVSRGSRLALWQSEAVRDQLRRIDSSVDISIDVVKTTGDRILDVPLARIGDRGLFTKELDVALLSGSADFAVHSLKDVPTILPDGLVLAAVGEREDPRDVLIGPSSTPVSLDGLQGGMRIGTSSLRRRAQLKHHRPDLRVEDLRGNLDTRLRKVDQGEYDAILLAAAGVHRMDWAARIGQYLDPDRWLPAVAQGALGIVCREDDRRTLDLLASLDHGPTRSAVTAERSFLRGLEGGCQVPIGALATTDGDSLALDGFVAGLDGQPYLRDQIRGPAGEAADLGRALAARLHQAGAAEILEDVRTQVES